MVLQAQLATISLERPSTQKVCGQTMRVNRALNHNWAPSLEATHHHSTSTEAALHLQCQPGGCPLENKLTCSRSDCPLYRQSRKPNNYFRNNVLKQITNCLLPWLCHRERHTNQ
jgi:hypothetical protein